VLAFVNNSAYSNAKILQVYWAGLRYSATPHLDVTAANYGVNQNAYGTGTQAGCSTAAHSTCSGNLEAISLDADYRFNVHFDAYLGAMYSQVRDGWLAATSIRPISIRPLACALNSNGAARMWRRRPRPALLAEAPTQALYRSLIIFPFERRGNR